MRPVDPTSARVRQHRHSIHAPDRARRHAANSRPQRGARRLPGATALIQASPATDTLAAGGSLDIAKIVAEYLSITVWPAVLVTAVLLFRKNIARLLDESREITGFGATVKRGDAAASRALASSLDATVAGEPASRAEPEPTTEQPELQPSTSPHQPRRTVVHDVQEELRLAELSKALDREGPYHWPAMDAGQAVWDALRDLRGEHAPLPSTEDELRAQTEPWDVPQPIIDTLIDIMRVYNGLVITLDLKLSAEGWTSYEAACANAIRALAHYARSSPLRAS